MISDVLILACISIDLNLLAEKLLRSVVICLGPAAGAPMGRRASDCGAYSTLLAARLIERKGMVYCSCLLCLPYRTYKGA
jgi:hypothetical protein